MDQQKIGKFIQQKRKELGLTQAQLAEKLGVSDKTISNWENGRNLPDVDLYHPLCELFNISIDELLNGEKKKTNAVSVSSTSHSKKKIVFILVPVILCFLVLFAFLLFKPKEKLDHYSKNITYTQEDTVTTYTFYNELNLSCDILESREDGCFRIEKNLWLSFEEIEEENLIKIWFYVSDDEDNLYCINHYVVVPQKVFGGLCCVQTDNVTVLNSYEYNPHILFDESGFLISQELYTTYDAIYQNEQHGLYLSFTANSNQYKATRYLIQESNVFETDSDNLALQAELGHLWRLSDYPLKQSVSFDTVQLVQSSCYQSVTNLYNPLSIKAEVIPEDEHSLTLVYENGLSIHFENLEEVIAKDVVIRDSLIGRSHDTYKEENAIKMSMTYNNKPVSFRYLDGYEYVNEQKLWRTGQITVGYNEIDVIHRTADYILSGVSSFVTQHDLYSYDNFYGYDFDDHIMTIQLKNGAAITMNVVNPYPYMRGGVLCSVQDICFTQLENSADLITLPNNVSLHSRQKDIIEAYGEPADKEGNTLTYIEDDLVFSLTFDEDDRNIIAFEYHHAVPEVKDNTSDWMSYSDYGDVRTYTFYNTFSFDISKQNILEESISHHVLLLDDCFLVDISVLNPQIINIVVSIKDLRDGIFFQQYQVSRNNYSKDEYHTFKDYTAVNNVLWVNFQRETTKYFNFTTEEMAYYNKMVNLYDSSYALKVRHN